MQGATNYKSAFGARICRKKNLMQAPASRTGLRGSLGLQFFIIGVSTQKFYLILREIRTHRLVLVYSYNNIIQVPVPTGTYSKQGF